MKGGASRDRGTKSFEGRITPRARQVPDFRLVGAAYDPGREGNRVLKASNASPNESTKTEQSWKAATLSSWKRPQSLLVTSFLYS
jgi:hypothetical protein